MKLISVHLPEWMIKELEKLVQKGYFPSRSEAIRVAIHILIMKYQDMGNKQQSVPLLPGR
ncbi:MAG: type II toxin-antitoxin system ParD family antitoxin [Crenarchaeota archaeon]|nr:type II toxin-antitoxin system ParD family antitoxin [Thermoproteota archaeon]